MSLMKSRQKKIYRWDEGDLITAAEACALLRYKSSNRLQDSKRRAEMVKEFELHGCTLTVGIFIGREQRFLRSEIDAFISAVIEDAQATQKKRDRDLRLAA